MDQRTRPDYVTLSCGHQLQAMRHSVQAIFEDTGGAAFEPGGPLLHFETSERVTVGGIHAGMLMFGGATQKDRAVVQLLGKGCDLVRDWTRAEDALLSLPRAVFKRGDIAADFYRGEVTHERVVEAHFAGKFQSGGGGRQPRLQEVLTSDANFGRTAYVGARGSDKFLRCYEKGKKEFQGGDWAALRRCVEGEVSGCAWTRSHVNGGEPFDLAAWYRVELELRADKRPLPEDWITRRDEYFAGAYPFTAQLLPEVEGQVLVTPRLLGILSVERALEVIRTQWGRALYTAAAVHFGDIGAVWDKIVGREHSARLVEAGALLALDQEPEARPERLH